MNVQTRGKYFQSQNIWKPFLTAGQQIKMESSSTYSKHLQTKASWSHDRCHILKLSDKIYRRLASFMIINAFYLYGGHWILYKLTHSGDIQDKYWLNFSILNIMFFFAKQVFITCLTLVMLQGFLSFSALFKLASGQLALRTSTMDNFLAGIISECHFIWVCLCNFQWRFKNFTLFVFCLNASIDSME